MNAAFVARMEDVLAACVAKHNAARATVHWQFTLEKARTKLNRHYQKIKATNSPD